MLLEVIVQTVDDALAAQDGGADRLEVVRDIEVGGLTPAIAVVEAIQAATRLPLRVMVRENAGFSVGDGELSTLRAAVAALDACHVDGVVMGFADDGDIALDDLARVLDGTPRLRVTFHRAFDTLHTPLEAVDLLAGLPQIDRILTDGGPGSPVERSRRLAALGERVRTRGTDLRIIAGSGVDDEALAIFVDTACVREAHVGRAARADNRADGPVSALRVRQLRSIADGRF
ncbi:MAG: copper homeostasis protein CutC [Vicinamibacterales bacterium]